MTQRPRKEGPPSKFRYDVTMNAGDLDKADPIYPRIRPINAPFQSVMLNVDPVQSNQTRRVWE